MVRFAKVNMLTTISANSLSFDSAGSGNWGSVGRMGIVPLPEVGSKQLVIWMKEKNNKCLSSSNLLLWCVCGHANDVSSRNKTRNGCCGWDLNSSEQYGQRLAIRGSL